MTYWMVRLMALCGMAYAIKLPKIREEPADTATVPRLRTAKRPHAPGAGDDDESELATVVR
jgi:hypothetical protein